MIHYHGGPITPIRLAESVWSARHAFVSFARTEQVGLAAEICQSFALDNGAYTAWKQGRNFDHPSYRKWVLEYIRHPGFDWCLIPDVIDGTEEENEELISNWDLPTWASVPVYHLHEKLTRLASLQRRFPRIALGSSGEYRTPGSASWKVRMHQVMQVICDQYGRPKSKIHGLRMLDPTIFSLYPFSSADSTNVARNSKNKDARLYKMGPEAKSYSMLRRIESHGSAVYYSGPHDGNKNKDLVG